MRDIADLMSKIEQNAPGVAEPLAVQHICDAARKWCQKTRCWRDVDSFTSDGDGQEIMCVPPFAELYQIEWATWDGRKLTPVSFSEYMGRLEDQESGQPRFITQATPGSVMLLPAGGETGTLKVSSFLMPKKGAEVLPDFMVEQWADELAYGALATLLLLPNVPFASVDLAGYFGGMFQKAIDDNFDYNRRGQQRGRPRTKHQFF